jgi:hypothetical protein
VDHDTPQQLNAALDQLKAGGALLVEVRRLRADLEAALAEVASGPALPAEDPKLAAVADAATDSITAPVAEAPLPELPSPGFHPLRTLDATLRVAAEIAADLAARKVGWMALGVALLFVGMFLWGIHSQLVEGVAALGRVFGKGGGLGSGLIEQKTMLAMIGGNASRTLYWGGLVGGIGLSSLFAPPLLDPKRTVLLYAQPLSRADYALGLFCAVCGLGLACAFFFSALLFAGLRVLGLGVDPLLLLAPLPWLFTFGSLYAVVLLVTYFVRHPLIAAGTGFGFLGVCGALHNAVEGRPSGFTETMLSLLQGVLPKLVELSDQAQRIGAGTRPQLFPFLSTLMPTAALLLCLVVVARRSER